MEALLSDCKRVIWCNDNRSTLFEQYFKKHSSGICRSALHIWFVKKTWKKESGTFTYIYMYLHTLTLVKYLIQRHWETPKLSLVSLFWSFSALKKSLNAALKWSVSVWGDPSYFYLLSLMSDLLFDFHSFIPPLHRVPSFPTPELVSNSISSCRCRHCAPWNQRSVPHSLPPLLPLFLP